MHKETHTDAHCAETETQSVAFRANNSGCSPKGIVSMKVHMVYYMIIIT